MRKHFFTQVLGLGQRHGLEVMANLGARPPRSDKAQPSRIWTGNRRCDDFDHIAVVQLRAQGNLLAIDLGRHGPMPDVAVNGVSEVNHRGAPRHGHDLALGCEHIDRVGEKVDLDVIPELGGVACLVLNVEQRLQPLRAQMLRGVALGVVGLIKPVRRDARFGHHVHGLGAHLKLYGGARWPDEGGVQRLVAVNFRDGDVVFEAPGHRFVELVQHAHGGVARGQPAHDDPKAVNVGHLRERQVLFVHLAVDGVERFFAAVDVNRDAGRVKGGFHLALNALDDITSPAPGSRQGLGQRGVSPGMKMPE